MTPPASAARALHDIMAQISQRVSTTSETPYHAWQKVAGCEVPSREFAVYHAEVLTLFGEVEASLLPLPRGTQERYAKYLPTWWDALARPRNDWAASASAFVAPEPLDMLASLADYLEERRGPDAAPRARRAEVLHTAVETMLHHVQQDDTLPTTVRDQIAADLKHVLWLLGKVDTFGVEHAVAATEKATGKILTLSATSGLARIKAIGAGLVTVLAVTACATGSVAAITSDVRETLGISQGDATDTHIEMVQNTVVEICEAHPPKELLPGKGQQTGGDEVVDAEIVDDDQP
ncbi:hypothetical protein [Luteipulveratus flavus]|uniref:Uncharacterized protein n=1 Tax=Luteipulveratus flavus TaxID=3031728 RepID=A0ABT6CB17_9MICO|nr:hypothetical protein [Luteipulveratus sp. YIM 133296]MDF8266092.1 hypothetical protein [Luteipulveratus sp. YIM 133296]